MLNMEKQTKLSAAKAAEALRKFFGPGGEGLEIVGDDGCCLSFQSNLGYVTATVTEKEGQTTVQLVTREFEYQVKKYLARMI